MPTAVVIQEQERCVAVPQHIVLLMEVVLGISVCCGQTLKLSSVLGRKVYRDGLLSSHEKA